MREGGREGDEGGREGDEGREEVTLLNYFQAIILYTYMHVTCPIVMHVHST